MRALVTLGTFDGVHKGHQRLLRRVLALSARLGLRSTVVLFDRPPRFFFHPSLAVPLLTTAEERRELLLAMGVAVVKVLPFNRHMAHVPHTRFFEEYVLRRCRAGGLVAGPDFAFGRGRRGDIPWLAKTCRLLGLRLAVLPLARAAGRKIGSSRIRELLLAGDVSAAGRLLGRPHFASGRVVRGRGLGRRLGLPTANIAIAEGKLVPPGVFKVRVHALDGPGLDRLGVCNVGTRPTISATAKRHIEVHIPRFAGELYGRLLRVEFLRRIRGERKFSSLDGLKARIRRDIRAALAP